VPITPSGGSYTSEGTPVTPPRDRPVILSLLLVFAGIAAVVLLVVLYMRWKNGERTASWDAAALAEEKVTRARRHANVTAALAAIRSSDDAFSFVLFEDFLYALYAEAHTARAAGDVDRLAPYLSNVARTELRELPANGIDGIVIGGMRVESITTLGDKISLDAVFTTNLAEKDFVGKPAAFYMEERWTLCRFASARSRPPERARVVGCPSCGGPLDKMVMQKCGYCGVTSPAGEFDWFVEDIEVVHREARGPMLTGTTEEVGTDAPTIVAPDARREMDALNARDPGFTWASFVNKVRVVFDAFHTSWSAQDLTAVRPYLSDNLFELQRYWVSAYKQQGLHNRTENPTIVTVHLARISHDRFFDAVTVRVFATCVDYTTDEKGAVVGGDRTKPREYTEYWTFIRGVAKAGAPRADGACPSCGAAISGINMAGQCTHCNAKVTSGEFDWVLSRIEQDEVYEAAA
jgi:predicted lipid-binding transport protein (Tim44 family)